MTAKKRIMRKLKIDEISSVDRPAQAPAQAVIMKRDEPVQKTLCLLEDEKGHSHLLDDNEQGGTTSYDRRPGAEYGHSHPWVKDAEGKVSVGASDGHTHGMLGKRVEATITNEYTAKRCDAETQLKENEMSDVTKAAEGAAQEARVTALEAKLAKAEALAGLNDSEKAYHKGLNEVDGTAFLKMSGLERASILTKALESNPVVFKSADGAEFRKNDDPRLVAMAKRNDELAKSTVAAETALATQTLAKRAGDELGSLPGEAAEKVALLKAVDGIADEATRTKALAILKAGNSAIKAAFTKAGTSGGAAPEGAGDANARLETLAKAYAETNKLDLIQARVKVLDTPEGATLYAQTIAR